MSFDFFFSITAICWQMLNTPRVLTKNAISDQKSALLLTLAFGYFLSIFGFQCLLLLRFRHVSQLVNDSGKLDLIVYEGE